MSAPEYKPGEKLRVTIDVTAEPPPDAPDDMLVTFYEGARGRLFLPIPLDQPGVTIERLAPAEGVQEGDLWRDGDGDLWFAHQVDANDDTSIEPYLIMQPVKSSKRSIYYSPMDVHRRYVLVELVHREPVGPEAAAFRERLAEAATSFPTGDVGRHPEAWPVDEPETVPIAGVAPGTVVRAPELCANQPVIIDSVEDAGEHYDEVKVSYSGPAVLGWTGEALVSADLPVTIVEASR